MQQAFRDTLIAPRLQLHLGVPDEMVVELADCAVQ